MSHSKSPTVAGVSSIACPPGTLPGGPVRTRFFDGMFLTQADLENEQRYSRLKRQLTNRALGEGVAWGLRVTWNERPRTFTLSPGYAIDCCGNDLVVECPVEVSERQLWALAQQEEVAQQGKPTGRNDGTQRYCLALEYVECPEDARPVHRDACGGPFQGCEPSRIRESVRLVLVPPPPPPPLSPPEVFLREFEKWKESLKEADRSKIFAAVNPSAGVPAEPSPLSLEMSFEATGGTLKWVVLPVPGTVPVPSDIVGGSSATFKAGNGWNIEDANPTTWEFADNNGKKMYQSTFTINSSVGTTTTKQVVVTGDVTLDWNDGNFSTGYVQATLVPSEESEKEHLPSCFADLIPGGWALEPSQGPDIVRALSLAILHGLLADGVHKTGSISQDAAKGAYAAAWQRLFGVNVAVWVNDKTESGIAPKLTQLVHDLYRRWCDGFVYPGPRCADSRPVVYLGSVEMTSKGNVTAFNPRDERRHVETAPLRNHWAAQRGIAPLDVIAARYASALCCVAGIDLASVPAGLESKDLPPWFFLAATALATPASPDPAVFLELNSVMTALLQKGSNAKQSAPSAPAPAPEQPVPEAPTKIVSKSLGLLRGTVERALPNIAASKRAMAAQYTFDVLKETPASAALKANPKKDVKELAAKLDEAGVSVADVAASNAEELLTKAGMADSAGAREVADTLVDLAEDTAILLGQTTVETLGEKFTRSAFLATENQAALKAAFSEKAALKELTESSLINAAKSVAGVKG